MLANGSLKYMNLIRCFKVSVNLFLLGNALSEKREGIFLKIFSLLYYRRKATFQAYPSSRPINPCFFYCDKVVSREVVVELSPFKILFTFTLFTRYRQYTTYVYNFGLFINLQLMEQTKMYAFNLVLRFPVCCIFTRE